MKTSMSQRAILAAAGVVTAASLALAGTSVASADEGPTEPGCETTPTATLTPSQSPSPSPTTSAPSGPGDSA